MDPMAKTTKDKTSKKKGGQGRAAGSRPTRSSALRRPPAKGWPRLRHKVRCWWQDLLEKSPVWVLLFVAVSTWSLLPREAFLVPRLEAGSIAGRTFIADRDLSLPDEAATRSLQQGARDDALPVYDFDRGLELERRRQLGDLFAAGRAAFGEREPADLPASGGPAARTGQPEEGEEEGELAAEILARISEASAFKITPDQLELLHQREFSTELEDRLSGLLGRVLRQGVVSDRELLLEHRVRGITVQELPEGRRRTQLDLYRYLDYPEQVRQTIEQELLGWSGLASRERRAFAELILANTAPNLTFNSSATLRLKEEAAAAVGTVLHTIRQGEVIVRKGERVDGLAARAIGEMAASRDLRRLLLTGLGTFALLGASALLVWLACREEKRRDRSRERLLSECAMLLTLALLGARLGYFVASAVSNAFENEPFNTLESYTYAIPLASLALVSVLLYGRNMALVLSLVFSLLVGHIAGGGVIWTTMFFAVASSFAGVFTLDHEQFKQRSAMTRAGAVIGLVNAVALLVLKAMTGEVAGGPAQIGFDLVCGFAGGLLAAAVASFSIPIFEGLLQITTAIKLIELANPNLPLLRRLALEAPGTFQHSLAVANLAKSGAEAIDGDSVLLNTSALYHDIGKVFRPHYFIENQAQMGGANPHDKVQPTMSALILINHVKEGLELAHQFRLPEPIFEAIEQHHGTRLIKFFYNRAKERADGDKKIGEKEFRYPGPKPRSKEMGILMLADAVEAASRTLVDPGQQKLRTLLRAIFDDCLNDGQLDRTDLTLGDLRQIEDAFLRVLTNIFHQRVDYPGFDFNRGGERPVRREASGVVARDLAAEPAAGDPAAAELAGERRKAS